jgi:hypothetical protein
MGSLFSPSKQTSTSTSTPWGPQGDALKGAFGDAQSVYDSQKGTPYYQGNTYASMDPLTSQGIGANAGFATGAGAGAASDVLASGNPLLAAGGQGLSAYQKLAGMAGTDPTQGNIASAGAYANNPFLDGQIDAASRDVTRNLNENQLPGLNEAATGSGNMNSSRAGVAEGIARRGAADQIGDIASNMRGQAYQSGLGLAESGRTADMNGLATAGSGFGSTFGQGLGAIGQGLADTYGNNNQLISGGQLNQQDAQGADTAAFNKWSGNDNRQNDLLNRYMSIIGSQNWGGSATSTQPGPSMFQTLLGAGASAAGAALSFSDPRLKTAIKATGEFTRKHGLPIFTWLNRNIPGLALPSGPQCGVMATDVARLAPEALGMKDGYLAVDYGKLV